MTKRRQTPSPFTVDLPPVEIGLLYDLIPGDHERAKGGIGLRHVEVPLVVHIARPDNSPIGTTFQLYWGGVVAAYNQIRAGDEGLTRIPFTVPDGFVRESWADPVFARVIRNGGNPSETQPLRLRVNLRRPGAQAPEPTKDGNRHLVLVLPPDVEVGGVSDDRAKLGIEVIFRHWLNMAAYDLVRLVWGSEVIERWVQPNEVGTDITITVDYATLVEAGDSELLPVAFQVIGNTGNAPDPRAPWSVVSRVPVYIGSDRLDAPWLEFPDTAPSIDLIELGNQHVKIGLYVSAADARVYERVFLIWAGSNEGGSVPHVGDQELPGGRTYYFEVPNALVKAIASGSAVVHYLLEGNGLPAKRSHNLFLSIIGAVLEWPAPVVVEAVGGIIDPDLADVTVRFPEQVIWRADDLIQITLLAGDANNTIEYKVSARFDSIPNVNGELFFTLEGSHIKRFDGLPIEVFYTLLRTGQDSLRQPYQVGEPKRDMPAPQIEKENGGQLDPNDVLGGAKVLAPFTGTLVGDWMTLYWRGPLASTTDRRQVTQNGATTTFEIAHQFIAPNLNERVTAWYTLERGTDTPRYSQITPVLIAHGLMELPPPDLRQASNTGPGTANLAPLNALNGSKLRVSYTGMRGGDEIKVIMSGTPGAGSPDIPSQWGDATTQWIEFDISREAIAANIGNANKVVTFRYVVTRAGNPKESQELTVTVLPIPESELEKTIIRINEADPETQILDLTKVAEGATSYVGSWPFITAPWPVWLRLKGKKNGLDYAHTLYDGSAGAYVNPGWVANGYFEYPIPYDYLKELDHGSALIMEFKAALSESTVEAQTIVFPNYQCTIVKVDELVIDENDLLLAGRSYYILDVEHQHVLPNFGPGNSFRREVKGGTPPYTFLSSSPSVAHVDITGLVTSRGNGQSLITVRDSSVPPQTKSYTVKVSNVIYLKGLGAGSYSNVVNTANQYGVRLTSLAELRELSSAFGNRWPMGNFHYWSTTFSHSNIFNTWHWCRNINTGAESAEKTLGVTSHWGGVGMR